MCIERLFHQQTANNDEWIPRSSDKIIEDTQIFQSEYFYLISSRLIASTGTQNIKLHVQALVRRHFGVFSPFHLFCTCKRAIFIWHSNFIPKYRSLLFFAFRLQFFFSADIAGIFNTYVDYFYLIFSLTHSFKCSRSHLSFPIWKSFE